jgi:hypothetical protein
LDPADTTVVGTWQPSGWLPEDVRAFGRYPNVEGWKPGDLLLFSSTSPDWVSRAIQQFQTLGHSEDHAMWTHAAVYVGDSTRLSDSDFNCFGPRGVSLKPFYEYLGTHRILVRRPKGLTEQERFELVLHAVSRNRQKYGFRHLLKLGWTMRRRLKSRLYVSHSFAGSVFCSRLYADAYLQVTQRVLQDPWVNDTTPAFLSMARDLEDVPSRWLTIGPPSLAEPR